MTEMEKTEYQEIIIEWGKRIPIEKAEDFKKFDIEKKKVLYQIYGDHHIYGRDTLLYIGISTNADNRMQTHFESSVFQYVNNCSVSIGTIKKGNKDELQIPESILIANHKPSFNKDFIHFVSEKARQDKIIVINNGNNGMLQTCCTNFWWVKK